MLTEKSGYTFLKYRNFIYLLFFIYLYLFKFHTFISSFTFKFSLQYAVNKQPMLYSMTR